jgi:uncharacterized membrane protein YccC
MPEAAGQLKMFFRGSLNLMRSEYFSDALRTALSIILPFGALYYFSGPHIAIMVGVGALLVSLTDSPGTLGDKILMAISSLSVFFVVSLITALLMHHALAMAILVLVLCVVFALFTVFGKRWSLLGTMALILMTFVQGLKPEHPLIFSIYITAGGLCYYLISIIQTRLWPLSSVKHALGECMISTSRFLSAKAAFYNTEGDLQANYLRIIKLHNKVSEKQEQVRDLLLRNKLLMQNDHAQGQRHLLAIVQVIDLYELIGAIQYDYEALQQSLADTGLLDAINSVIGRMADDLHSMGTDLSAKLKIKQANSSAAAVEFLRRRIQTLDLNHQGYHILVKLQRHVDDIHQGVLAIGDTLTKNTETIELPKDLPAYHLFTAAEGVNLSVLKKHLNYKSPIFKFVLRLTTACLVAYGLMLLPVGNYSYWILLTVIVVIKPGFGLTRKRNLERLKGTMAGILIGVSLLALTSNIVLLLVLAGIFLFGYFAYLRLNYTLSIMSLTPMVIICLNIYTGQHSVVVERIFDTLMGCAIIFGASYLFPSWEVKKHGLYIGDVIRANISYLQKLYERIEGKPTDVTALKLARKEVYTRLAMLSSGIQNMLLEPKNTRTDVQHLYQFEILSHQLSSTIASFFPFADANGHLKLINNQILTAMEVLENSLLLLQDPEAEEAAEVMAVSINSLAQNDPNHVDQFKVQQILKISEAIRKQVGIYLWKSTE